MTEFTQAVEKQKIRLEAEEWANSTEWLQLHSLSSMWYDDRPQDTEGGKMVTDICYKSGLIERTLSSGEKVYFGEQLKGEDLVDAYMKSSL